MRQPPYTTKSGLQIGLLYQPPLRLHHDRDARLLQDALLNTREAGAMERFITRLLRRFWMWC